jgi:ubiquitin-conjugating enzyme E2 S
LRNKQCELAGPQGTPYESKFFLLKLVFPLDFPASPPRGFFLTKIYHPNVEMSGGAICVNTLKKDWTSAVTLSHVLAVIRCLLIVPFPESSLNDEAGKLFMNSYQEYYNRAKLMADVHGRSESICSRANNNNREQDNDDEQPVKKIMATDDRVLKNSSSSSSNNTNNNNSQQLPLSTTSAAPQFLQTKELPQKKLDKKKGLKRL